MDNVEELVFYGQYWFDSVTLLPQDGNTDIRLVAQSFCNEINSNYEDMNLTSISIRPGVFSPKEPMIYLGNKAYRYTDFIRTFRGNMATTLWIFKFLNNEVKINDFNSYGFTSTLKALLQTFVSIICISEVGRGYTRAHLIVRDFVKGVYNGEIEWDSLPSFFPAATTFAEDEKSSYREDE